MKLIAIILNYNTLTLTLKAMESAVKALAFTGNSWKLLVIDNCSPDGSGEQIGQVILEKKQECANHWNSVEFIQSDINGGFGAGNNIGFSKYIDTEEEPEYFYVLNSDAFPEKNAIKLLVDSLECNPECGIAGSYIFGVDDSPHATAFRFPTFLSELEDSVRLGILTRVLSNHLISLGIPEKTRKVDWLAGASMLVRSNVLKDIGLFDEGFFLYFEETDLCHRAKKKGWDTIYVKESHVAHVGSASTGMKTITRIPQFWLDSRKLYFQKNYGSVYFILATAARILGESIYRIRVIVEGKKEGSPKFFIRDLVKHTVFSRSARMSNNK